MRAARNADQMPPLGQGIQGWYVLKFAHPQGGTRRNDIDIADPTQREKAVISATKRALLGH